MKARLLLAQIVCGLGAALAATSLWAGDCCEAACPAATYCRRLPACTAECDAPCESYCDDSDDRCNSCNEDACDSCTESAFRGGCDSWSTLFSWSGLTPEGGPAGWDEPLETDRPDFTEASSTVGCGVVQLEMGYTFIMDDEDGVRTREHSYPETLLRVGMLAEWFEARIGWNNSHQEVRTAGVTQNFSGSEDLYLGAKIGLTVQEGLLPEMAIMPQMTVPSGSGDVTAGEVPPGVNWLYGWDLANDWSTGGSTQWNRRGDGTDGFYDEVAQSWTVGYGITDELGMYVEWFAFFPTSTDLADDEHYLDGGFTYLLSNNLQLDIRAGLGLNDAAADAFFGTGASIRF